MTTARNAQLARETLFSKTGDLQVIQVVRETLKSGATGSTRVDCSQLVRETLISSTSPSGDNPGFCSILW